MKTKNKTVSRVLTLLLAVVMVFTSMNYGMWGGAEIAWAGEAEDAAKLKTY
mgnify:FL=1